MDRRDFLQFTALSTTLWLPTRRNPRSPQVGHPIIDVHMHAYPDDMELPAAPNPATGRATPVRSGASHRAACLAEMRRLNIVKGVVSGGSGDRLGAAMRWREADPGRFLAGAAIRGSEDTPLPALSALRAAFAARQLGVLGEVTSQYAGLQLDDPQYEPFLALAEELDIPVALHTGTMPPGMPFDPCCRTARMRLGNPLLVEEVLNRHPKLRLNLMHAGWPFGEETIAILFEYPQVNADLGAINWLLPREEFYAYLSALMRAGFGKRLMFGSDQMFWPEGIGMAVRAVHEAPFLTPAAKRNIFYENALRFFRLP
jgi:uncharacterized protein